MRTLWQAARRGLIETTAGQRSLPFLHPAVLLPRVILLFVVADIVGWIVHIPLLTSVLPDFPTMKPNTAIVLGLLAACCLMRAGRLHEPRGRLRRTPLVTLGVAMILSCGTLLEYASGKSFGLDNFLLAVSLDRFGDPPGRMAMGTALCLTLSGVAIVLLDRAPQLSVWTLMTTNVISVSALISFAVNTGPMFSVPWLRSLSVTTALCLVMLAVAALVSRPELSLGSYPLQRKPGGGSLSGLIDSFVVLPLLMAAPSVVAMHAHISEAMMTLLILAVLLYSVESWLGYLRTMRQQRGAV